MANVLITTIYSFDSIVMAITKFSIERVYILCDEETEETQQKAINLIKQNYSKVIEIKEKKIPVYDLVKITEKCIELIDAMPGQDKVYINITPSRKTQSIGLLYAAYKRAKLVHKIIYISDDKKEIITLPLLEFTVTKTQQQLLESIKPNSNLSELSEKLKQSRAMLYRNIKELKEKGYIEDNHGFQITDAGKIARM